MSHPLIAYRQAQGLTQAQLAVLLGVSRAQISLIESDRQPVRAERVLDWERQTGIPRHELRPDLYPAPTAPVMLAAPIPGDRRVGERRAVQPRRAERRDGERRGRST